MLGLENFLTMLFCRYPCTAHDLRCPARRNLSQRSQPGYGSRTGYGPEPAPNKAVTIEFRKPGRGTVRAHFHLTDRTLADIYTQTANGDKYLPEFKVDITDSDDELVARGIKTLYIRRKQRSNDAATS